MSKAFESDINLKGLLEIGGSVGTAGQALLSQGPGLPPVWGTVSSGATDLSYDDATRLLSSSTGADVTLPLVTSTTAGLLPQPPAGAPTGKVFTDALQWEQPTGGGGGINGLAAFLTF